MKKKFVTMMVMVMATALWAIANDSEYYSVGNQLVPVQSTQISVMKEILTVNLTNDGVTHFDVYYEFRNDGPATDILMGFEAMPPKVSSFETRADAPHPSITDFQVKMNGTPLPYKNALSENGLQDGLHPVEISQWVYNQDLETPVHISDASRYLRYAYVYYFNAHFRPGINVVHHTYAYKESNGVNQTFWIDYKLTPANRWANKRIDDFTLRITSNGISKHFAMNKAPFIGAKVETNVRYGTAKMRELTWGDIDDESARHNYYEVTMRDAVVEWHITNFQPQAELLLSSVDMMVINHQFLNYQSTTGEAFGESVYYDGGVNFVLTTDGKLTGNHALNQRIVRNLPYAARGYQFKNPQLRKFFNSQWWYMPNPNYNPEVERLFTPRERQIVKGTFNDFVP